MGLSLNDQRAPYEQIADEFRTKIRSGELEPGQRLPSTRELMNFYEVANQTIQNSIRVLRDEGLVRSVAGRGTFVEQETDWVEITDGDAPSADYVILRDQLELISQAIDKIEDRIHTLEEEKKSESLKKLDQ